MSKLREQYLECLGAAVKGITEKVAKGGELTREDVAFIQFYEKRLNETEQVSPVDQITSILRSASRLMKSE